MNWKNAAKYLAKFFGLFIYFSLALLLIVVGAGAAAGGLITGDSWSGILILWVGAIVVALGMIGKDMITKIKVSFDDLQRAFKKAAEKLEEDSKKK